MKRILIVGATSGIGEGLARLYAERGEVKIGVMGRRSGRLKDLCASRPDVFEAEVCDVTDTEALPVALERLASRLGGVDILVLASGTGDLNPELDYAVERCTLDTAMAKGEGLFWVAPVDKACRQIARGIDRRRKVVYVTRRWRLAAWVYRHIPGWLYVRMMKG